MPEHSGSKISVRAFAQRHHTDDQNRLALIVVNVNIEYCTNLYEYCELILEFELKDKDEIRNINLQIDEYSLVAALIVSESEQSGEFHYWANRLRALSAKFIIGAVVDKAMATQLHGLDMIYSASSAEVALQYALVTIFGSSFISYDWQDLYHIWNGRCGGVHMVFISREAIDTVLKPLEGSLFDALCIIHEGGLDLAQIDNDLEHMFSLISADNLLVGAVSSNSTDKYFISLFRNEII